MNEIQLDLVRQEKAKEYARASRRLMVLDLLTSALYMLAWLVFGWAVGLRGTLEGMTANPWLQVLAFAAVFGVVLVLIGLPLSFYSGFVLPHRYGQSNQTLKGWGSDQVKGLVLGGVFGVGMVSIVYALLRAAPGTWWLWAALVMLVINVLLSNLAPVLIFPLFYRFKPLDEQHADLSARLTGLAERAGTRVKGVYQFDMSSRTKSANAALTGLGNTRRIILGDTMLAEFEPDEVEAVLAHELGHHVHRDIPVLMAFEAVLTLVGLFIASLVLNWGASAFGLRSVADSASMPLLGLAMGVYGLVTMPLSNAISRWRERMADQYALEATRNPRAFASVMTRLANQNLADVDPEPWVEFFLYSHPALNKRISLAKQFERAAKIE